MNDSPEILRRKIEDTKSDLYDDLESLQKQVSETVRSATNVVSSTVDSVRDTVTAVTQGTQAAVQACQDVFDVPRHINRHPWLVVSGAVVVGFLAVRLLSKSKTGSPAQYEPMSRCTPPSDLLNSQALVTRNETHGAPPQLTSAGRTIASDSPWQRLGNMAASSIQLMLQEAASRATTQVLGYLAGQGSRLADSNPQSSSATLQQEASRERNGGNNATEPFDRRQQS